ncbi:hypothetical protein EI94DRAFT_1799447 [Lactarius quietus]|nr:hypothetical protein EI94DRAFT_1799447 [Lactarius quietus]
MDSSESSTPTTEASPRAYHARYSFDDIISLTSSTSDESSETNSFVYNQSNASSDSSQTSIASYKTEKTVNSRKSHYNTLPRHKYAGLEHLRPLQGPTSSDVDDASVLKTDLRDESHEANNSGSSASPTTEHDTTIDDILKTVERFRILSVGRSGVSKSSLINCVFCINNASVSHLKPGVSDIDQEHVSQENEYLVLHDSQGLEPGDLSNFRIVRKFLAERSHLALDLKDRVHGLWLCVETPTAGGRVFETGDEELLKFVQRIQIPIVIVFTQYDRLVRTKRAELKEDHPRMDDHTLESRSVEEASKAFEKCLQSLRQAMRRLNVQMPPYARVSVRPGHREDISELVEVTRKTVKERLQGDAWIIWAIAQRANLPVKIDACITTLGYTRSLSGGGRKLLRDCLTQIHKDIITCWNFKGKILYSEEFMQLMLYLVQDVIDGNQPHDSAPDRISQFVNLLTATDAPILPPVAILCFKSQFIQWLSTTVLGNEAPVQRLLFAYAVDLIRVLRELFDITLRPDALTTTWPDLKEALESYDRSPSRRHIHKSILSYTPHDGWILTAKDLSNKLRELLNK